MDPNLPQSFGTGRDAIPAQFVDRLQRMEAQIAELQRARPSTNTDMKDGTFTVRDAAGNQRVIFGLLPGGDYGFQVINTAGQNSLLATGSGLEFPAFNVQYRASTSPINITSGSFTATWESFFGSVAGDSIHWSGAIVCDAGTTGEVRLNDSVNGTYSAVISCAAGVQTSPVWNWRVPLAPGLQTGAGAAAIRLEVRRTAGAGTVFVYPPNAIYVTDGDAIGATATGI